MIALQQALPMELPRGSSAPARTSSATTFADNMTLPVHRWFRYSAGCSAQWAQDVIETHHAKRVLDPFAGSGTTILAAEQAHVESAGVDIHPFVSRVARAKLSWRAEPSVLMERAAEILDEAPRSATPEGPVSSLVERCFEPSSLDALLRLRDTLGRLRQGDAYDDLLWLAFVSIIRPCSPVGTAQWQYVLPGKSKANVAEPYSAFSSRACMFGQDMFARSQLRNAPQGTYYEEDAREMPSVDDGWADLVVTSPPYANNYDYADIARLEMSLLGEIDGWGDLKPLRNKLMRSCSQQMTGYRPDEALSSHLLAPIHDELTAVYMNLDEVRQTKGGRKAYHTMILAYFHDSAQVWRALRRVTSDGSTICYVVGDSAPYGVYVPVERWLGDLAVAAGFKSWRFEQVRERNTKWKNRKHRVPLREGYLWIEG